MMSLSKVKLYIKFLIFALSVMVVTVSYASGWELQSPVPNSRYYNSVWGSSESDVYVVGEWGSIIHFDGVGWSIISDGLFRSFNCVWGSSKNDVYVGGDESIMHYDGKAWSELYVSRDIQSIWGTSFDNVYAVGSNGVILHYDGTSWEFIETVITEHLNGVWGTSETNVFAVGDEGTILNYNGITWSIMNSETDNDLLCIWGSSNTVIYASGSNGTLLKYDGNNWATIETPYASYAPNISSICSDFNGGIYVTSSTIQHFDGVEWTKELFDDRPLAPVLKGLWGSSNNNIFAVGNRGEIRHFNGTEWRLMTNIPLEYLNDVYAISSNDVYAVGGNAILHYNGLSWKQTFKTDGILEGVWGSSESDVYAVGFDTVLHYNGEVWNNVDMGDTIVDLTSVWGTSSTNVYAVGNSGLILNYNGEEWKQMQSGTTNTLLDIWGYSENNIYAVGYDGTMVHYNGSEWSNIDTGAILKFTCIWGSSANDIFAMEDTSSGRLYHYDGLSWSIITPENFKFNGVDDIWGSSNTDIYFAGFNLYHFDGINFIKMDTNYHHSFNGISGTSEGDVFAVGADGLIAHHSTYNVIPTITLELPDTVTENDGLITKECKVIIENGPEKDLIIGLYLSNHTQAIEFPGTVFIPAGDDSAEFDIRLIDNSYQSGDINIELVGYGYGWNSESKSITIVDDESIVEENDKNNDSSCFINALNF